MSLDPIHRIGAGPPARGPERIGALTRVERREEKDQEREERPRKRPRPQPQRPEVADGHVDVRA